MSAKYFITETRRVEKEEFIDYERKCGFRAKGGIKEVATAGFSGQLGSGERISGRVED